MRLRFPYRVVAVSSALLVAVLATACDPTIPEPQAPAQPQVQAEYIVVEYRAGRDDGPEPAAAVTVSPAFRDARPKLRTAALRPPDACFQDQTLIAPGVPARTQLSLRPACGPWVSELELGLSDGGLQVIPWTQIVGREREKNLTTLQAAKDLHADVVFMFNRLALTDVQGDDGAARRFDYFAADVHGKTFGSRTVDESTRTDIESFASQILGGPPNGNETTALSTNVEASAVVPGTGEVLWTYQRTLTRSVGNRSAIKFLFGRYGDTPWNSVSPVSDPNDVRIVPMLSSEALNAERAHTWMGQMGPAHATGQYDAERYDLLHRGAIDFVRAFQSGP